MQCLLLVLVISSIVSGQIKLQQDEICPTSCYCDNISRYVHCQGENIGENILPGQIPRSVQRLELRDFHIGQLKWESTRTTFPNTLLELSIRNSEITELTNGTFVILNKLNNLDLSHNNLRLIQQGSFNQLISLRHLDLGWNDLKDVKGTFLLLKNLETLDLSNNKLELLSFKTFSGLQRLQWLDVSHNLINKIEPGTFLPTPSLERVVLGHNPLTSLQRLEFLGARLRYMDVSHMKLRRAPESLGSSVRELRATGNELSTIQRGDLDGYPTLMVLDVSCNRLVTLEDDALGRLEFLARLYLSGNNLEQVPASLPRSLRELYLDRNNIRGINGADLQGLPRLQRLSLRRNKLLTITSEVLGHLPALRYLDVSQNVLKSATFGPTGLEELDLSENFDLELTSVAFSTIPHLRTLHLNNLSQSFGPSLRELLTPLSEMITLNLAGSVNLTQQALQTEIWYGIQELNLQNTSLETIPDSIWSASGKLRTLNLGNNPWNCSAGELQLRINTRDARLHISNAANLKCEYPEILKGTPLLVNISTPTTASSDLATTIANVTLQPIIETSTNEHTKIFNTTTTKDVTPPPSLAPTRVQIAAPTSREPHSTNKPESTAPLSVEKSENIVDRKINNKSKKIKFQLTTTSINNKFINTSTLLQQVLTTPNSFENVTLSINTTSATIVNVTREVTNFTSSISPVAPPTPPANNNNMNVTSTVAVVTTTTDVSPVDYEELAAIIEEEEFYEEPGNFSLRQLQLLSSSTPHSSNVPIGFLSVLGACILGGIAIGVYQCRQQRKWQRLYQQEEILNMEVLSPPTPAPQRW